MNSERSIAELGRAVRIWIKAGEQEPKLGILTQVEECLRYFQKVEGYKRWKPAKVKKS